MSQRQQLRARSTGVLLLTLAASLLLGSQPLFAQQAAPGAPGDAPATAPAPPPNAGPFGPRRPPMRMGPPGRWWDNAEVAQKLGLSADQQKKMDEIFQQNRLKLIDDHAAVEKQETILEPLVAADQLDEKSVMAQVDRVADARAELEKANARMLIELRRQLTPQQWKTLQTIEPRGRHGDFDRDRRDRGDRRGGPGPGDGAPAPPPPPGGPGL